MNLAAKIMICVLMSAAPLLAETTLEVNVNRDQVYLGESFLMTIRLKDSDTKTLPDLSNLKDCKTTYLGSQNESQSMTIIINGKVTKSGYVGRTFTYEITPNKEGTVTAGPVTLDVGGRILTASGPKVSVLGIEAQDNVLISVTASKDRVFVDEPFDIRMAVAIRQLPAPNAEIDPLFPQKPPHIDAPFITPGPGMYENIDWPDIKGILNTCLAPDNEAGFTLNNYEQSMSPFNFVGFSIDDSMRRAARFRFNRRVINTNSNEYWEYSLTLKFTPRKEGDYTFGPVTFKGTYVASIDSAKNGTPAQTFAVGPAAIVRVVPPPEDGRPQSFIGSVGSNISVNAQLDTQNCNVGDPLKLTVSVGGNISMGNIRPPAFAMQDNFMSIFRIYEDTLDVKKSDNRRDFTWTIRPIKSGSLEVPPLEISYYDTTERKYKTVLTRPIPLNARATDSIDANFIINSIGQKNIQSLAGNSKNYAAPFTFNSRGADTVSFKLSAWQIIVIVVPPFFYLVIVVTQLSSRFIRSHVPALRRMRALDSAVGMLKSDNSSVCPAVRTYIGDKFGVASTGLTPPDIRSILSAQGIPDGLTEKACGIYEKYFNAGYSTDQDSNSDTDETTAIIGVLKEIDESVKRGGRQ